MWSAYVYCPFGSARWVMRAINRETGETYAVSCSDESSAHWQAYLATHR